MLIEAHCIPCKAKWSNSDYLHCTVSHLTFATRRAYRIYMTAGRSLDSLLDDGKGIWMTQDTDRHLAHDLDT